MDFQVLDAFAEINQTLYSSLISATSSFLSLTALTLERLFSNCAFVLFIFSHSCKFRNLFLKEQHYVSRVCVVFRLIPANLDHYRLLCERKE